MERWFKIKPHVISVSAGRKTLTDKEQAYPEKIFRGNADDLMRRGFIFQVPAPDSEKKISVPEKHTKTEQVQQSPKTESKGGGKGKK